MVGKSRFYALLFTWLMLCLILVPVRISSASLTVDGGSLYLSCVEDDDCLLSPTPIGEEVVTDSVFASPAQPKTVTIEFDMSPMQEELALLPSVLSRMEIDLRFTLSLIHISEPTRRYARA